MKLEWRKSEKETYIPKTKPQLIDVPCFTYACIKGVGNPNNEAFSESLGVLYALSYGIRMSYKWESPPADYFEYTVYPLEGVWDIDKKDKYVDRILDKDNLAYEIMIRQPNFVNEELFLKTLDLVNKKKPHKLNSKIELKSIKEGLCVQMLHLGSYDDEPSTFGIMDVFCEKNKLRRSDPTHREIYISDPRKTAPNKLKTTLRYKVNTIE